MSEGTRRNGGRELLGAAVLLTPGAGARAEGEEGPPEKPEFTGKKKKGSSKRET